MYFSIVPFVSIHILTTNLEIECFLWWRLLKIGIGLICLYYVMVQASLQRNEYVNPMSIYTGRKFPGILH